MRGETIVNWKAVTPKEPHSRELCCFLIRTSVCTTREGKHIHLISQMKHNKRSSLPETWYHLVA
jgi:hypothetical protein